MPHELLKDDEPFSIFAELYGELDISLVGSLHLGLLGAKMPSWKGRNSLVKEGQRLHYS